MLVGRNKTDNTNSVKFISYTGGGSSLCDGLLTLEIDGEIVKFGYDSASKDFREAISDRAKLHAFLNDPAYNPKFWSSGGWLDEDLCAHQGEWEINIDRLKDQYKKYAAEIDRVFNDNVPWGCCGGCA